MPLPTARRLATAFLTALTLLIAAAAFAGCTDDNPIIDTCERRKLYLLCMDEPGADASACAKAANRMSIRLRRSIPETGLGQRAYEVRYD